MTRRTRTPAALEWHDGQLLDWTAPTHWSWATKPCRYCGTDTHLRDSHSKPAHKVCAEQALAAQYAQAQDAYRTHL